MLPIDSIQFGCFLGAAIILAITPGPGILYVLARTISGGKSDGLVSTLGTAVGGLAHVLFAAAGLSALLATSAEAFLLVKYGGTAYLVYLGARRLMGAQVQSEQLAVQPSGTKRTFLEGMLTEALNVKTAFFFLAFLSFRSLLVRPHWQPHSYSCLALYVSCSTLLLT
jgi:threonine/homoserine/homoserine lactone efflux protein